MKIKYNKQFILFAIFIVLTFFSFSSMGRFIGSENTDAPGDTGSCAGDCHYKNDEEGQVTLNNVPLFYMPGETYQMTITIHDASSPFSENDPRRGGFQLVATNGNDNVQVGNFTDTPDTRILGNERLADSPHKFFSDEMVSWDVEWTAPMNNLPNNIVFYYAGISGNGDRAPDPAPASSEGGQDAEYRGQNSTTLSPVLATNLLFFEAQKTAQQEVLLQWKINTTIAQKGFYIQRAIRSPFDFEALTWIAVDEENIPSNGIYEYVDKNVLKGQEYYYRLQGEDEQGHQTFFDITSISIEGEEMQLYPNPTKDIFSLSLPNKNWNKPHVQIVNTVGNIVFEQNLDKQKKRWTIDVNDIEQGLYILQFFDANLLIEQQQWVKW